MEKREIKVKLWCADLNHFIAHDQEKVTVGIDGDVLIFGLTDESGDWHDLTPLQYTGLKDKAGDEIFEGDICTKMISPDEINLAPKELHRGVIVFHYGGFCYKCGDYYYPMSRTHGVINIIGNIHQHPDLCSA
jgi:uncharacterized phage protein (TIGR01671 family)